MLKPAYHMGGPFIHIKGEVMDASGRDRFENHRLAGAPNRVWT